MYLYYCAKFQNFSPRISLIIRLTSQIGTVVQSFSKLAEFWRTKWGECKVLCRSIIGSEISFCRVYNLKFWSHSAASRICWELIQKETFCILQNEKFSFYSAMLQNDTLYIGVNLGRILYFFQILIVSKLMQKINLPNAKLMEKV